MYATEPNTSKRVIFKLVMLVNLLIVTAVTMPAQEAMPTPVVLKVAKVWTYTAEPETPFAFMEPHILGC
jgi:hypothetical protein